MFDILPYSRTIIEISNSAMAECEERRTKRQLNVLDILPSSMITIEIFDSVAKYAKLILTLTTIQGMDGILHPLYNPIISVVSTQTFHSSPSPHQ